jgi:hypothetical protein
MNKKVFVIDVTQHQGDSRAAIEFVRSYVTSRHAAARIAWCTRPDQSSLLGDSEIAFEATGDIGNVPDAISNWISRSSQNGEAGSVFYTVSYDVRVLAAVAALNGANLIVVPMHMNNVRTEMLGMPAARRPMHFNRASAALGPCLSVDDAVVLAKRVLREGGHTSQNCSLPQSKLRERMSFVDGRARKNPLDASSVTMIKSVVDRGLEEGWLKRYRLSGLSGSERIWLAEQSEKVERQSVAEAAASNVVGPLARGLPDPDDTSPQVEKKRERSEQSEDVLRKEKIGTSARLRNLLFAAVEGALAKGGPIVTSDLMVASRKSAAETAKAGGYDFAKWPQTTECFFRMLAKAGVLLGENDQPIPSAVGFYSAKVKMIHPEFRFRSEMLLVEKIVRGLSDPTVDDRYSIGLAIYRQGKDNAVDREELIRRVDDLLAALAREVRIEFEGDRIVPPLAT